MKYTCQTLFDITATGVTGHYKSARVPFADRSGYQITNEESWHYSRNQQRNWETITQLLSMRAQVTFANNPKRVDGVWSFDFEVETPDAYGTYENPVKLLLSDTDGVPMLTDLNNEPGILPYLVVSGPKQNIWFTAEALNK